MSRPVIRLARADDIDQFYGGDKPHFNMRALVADLDGEILGVAGLGDGDGYIQAFSSMDDRLREYPRVIVEGLRRFRSMINGCHVFAVASDAELNSAKVLARCGFRYVEETAQGRLYQFGGASDGA